MGHDVADSMRRRSEETAAPPIAYIAHPVKGDLQVDAERPPALLAGQMRPQSSVRGCIRSVMSELE